MSGAPSRPTRGLALGKFLPLHNGHVHLLETGRKAVDELTIVVCSLSSEPIDGRLRLDWVRQAFPQCRVVHLDDDSIPQAPEDHPDFWNIWRTALRRLHPEPLDWVFSSESYGDRLASELGARHQCVDLDRKAFPVSGTQVRQNPLAHWNLLPTHVRPHFVKRVLLTGSESCGKSTLTEILARHYNTVGVQEYAREYLESMDFSLADLDHVAEEQYRLQQEARLSADKVCFSDTGALETVIYARHYLGSSSPTIDRHVELQKGNYDLILLLTPEVPWVDDGLRNLADRRWEMHQRYVDLLNELGLPYTLIQGADFAARKAQAIHAVDTLLKRSS